MHKELRKRAASSIFPSPGGLSDLTRAVGREYSVRWGLGVFQMELLARGRDCDVFDAGAGRVLRRYRDNRYLVERESKVMAYARSQGCPVPEVLDAQGCDLLLERVDGPTMAADLMARPWLLRRHARLLASIHAAVHSIAGPDWLDRPFGIGDSLLHLDLHPENVLIVGAEAVVIDWTNAAVGPAEADVLDTWLVVSAVRPSGTRIEAAFVGKAQAALAGTFRRAAEVKKDQSVLSLVARRRLADPNITSAERLRVQRLCGRG